MYPYLHFIRALATTALPGRPFPTATRLRQLDASEVIAACTASALPLSASTQELLKSKQIDGKDLLSMSAQHLVALGMKPGDAGELMEAVDFARFGGPVTVQLIYGAGREPIAFTFENPQNLQEFLTRLGAAGLSKMDRTMSSDKFRDLREGEVYTVDFGEGGDLRADVALAKACYDTDAKVVIENAKRAVVEASRRVFGEALTADVRNDIPLKWEGVLLGVANSLFKGPTMHVLLERKRTLNDMGCAAVIDQMNRTRKAYSLLELDMVDKKQCRVKSMLYAEALGAQAQQELLKAGIYVLSGETMAILSPAPLGGSGV